MRAGISVNGDEERRARIAPRIGAIANRSIEAGAQAHA
jgi:hypothetical protein